MEQVGFLALSGLNLYVKQNKITSKERKKHCVYLPRSCGYLAMSGPRTCVQTAEQGRRDGAGHGHKARGGQATTSRHTQWNTRDIMHEKTH